MLHTVEKVEYLEGYKLKLHFDDGVIKIVDLEIMLKKAQNLMRALSDISYFKKVTCDGTTIVWPNGVDLCPDVLYSMGKNAPKAPKKIVSVLKGRKKSRKKLAI